jgi:cation diffusion facilitator family transporter
MHDLHPHPVGTSGEERARLRAGLISLGVGALLLGAKFWAYLLTDSTAVLSDALESIVNVLAAAFALGGLVFAGRPADRSHPYGHGKIEFFSAGFEGGLIAFAAVMILWESFHALLHGVQVRNLDVGLAIVVGAGVANLLLGLFLVRTGRRTSSLTLVADGQHVLSDAWTSAGIVVGLLLVRLTGLTWLDPLVAMLVALNLLVTGVKLVRYAAGGLLDEEDAVLLGRLVQALDPRMKGGVIGVHNLRAIRSGRFHHVEAHISVPEFWSVERAHDATEAVADAVIAELGLEGRILFHADPCRRAWCAGCDVPDCAVRREPFVARRPLSVDEVVLPEPGPVD